MFNEDKLTIGDLAEILGRRAVEIERAYDELFITGEYVTLQREKRKEGFEDETYDDD